MGMYCRKPILPNIFLLIDIYTDVVQLCICFGIEPYAKALHRLPSIRIAGMCRGIAFVVLQWLS